MASSEQDGQRRPARLARHNSSFLGTIKTIVTAPLNWFAYQDEEATPGKRRRSSPTPATAATLPIVADDDRSRHSKRMRLHSPPRGYLDPPAASLRRPSVVPRASSAVLPSSRATLSPRRRHPIARTMSIDPPRRDHSFNFGIDTDTDMLVDKDLSLPPSPRPSFRMRSSMTPQPQQQPTRYISEPPPLNALISNPTFLHPPTQPQEPSPAPTLGSLVESVRATRSPVKQQHSALLFSSNASNVNNENKDAPAERALHQLDVYKTPLLPTRMRSSNLPASVTATTTPEMFKPRRSSHLVLMQDDRDRLGGRKVSGPGKSPVVNETKPYAGEGGMKKLLARRKLEEEEENEQDTVSKEDATPHARQPSPASILVPPVPTSPDWFSTAASVSSTSGSSLRVGRAKTSRNHIQRPSKTRFSAVYEEEPDDVMDDDESRQKERQMLEEAAKKVPVFQMPANFSFSKDIPPVKPADLDNAKEPPITSLPFSFSKPTPTPAAPAPLAAQSTTTQSATLEPSPTPLPEPKAAAPIPALTFAPAPAFASGGGIPNFFANSQVLAKAKETTVPAPTPILSFGTSSSGTSSTQFSFDPAPSTSSQPVQYTENPFWEGEKNLATEESKPTASLFGNFGKSVDKEPVTASPMSSFGSTASAFPPLSKPSTETTSSTDSAPASLPFSFGRAAQKANGDAKSSEPVKLPFFFGAPVEAELAAPKPLFGAGSNATTSSFGDAPKPDGGLFEEQPKTASSFGAPPPPHPTPSPLPFSFDAPPAVPSAAVASSQPSFFGAPASDTATTIDAPKPLFGGNNGFSFGQLPAADKEKEAKPASFSFGTAPSTPTPPPAPAAEPKLAPSPVFNFGQTSTAAPAPATNGPAPVAFSFSGGGSTTADVSNRSPFMFGQPSALTPTDRPVTPPKNVEQEFRMEESPTRELQQMNGNKTSATLNGAFSFGVGGSNSNGESLFGGQNSSPLPSSAPFSFGAPSTSNPFAAKDDKASAPSKGFGGFGQTSSAAPQITTSFSFGQPAKTPEEPQRPSTAGPFSFGGTPTSATSTNPAFSFGAPATTNAFGQPTSGSAPSSPSTFNQTTPFAFGPPAPSTNAPFAFGSQPNSPAGGVNLTLPQPAGGFGSGGGFGQAQQQPSSPFSAPIALAPSTSGGGGGGGSLFTIGAAPAASGPRQIKKLPNRRGGAKR